MRWPRPGADAMRFALSALKVQRCNRSAIAALVDADINMLAPVWAGALAFILPSRFARGVAGSNRTDCRLPRSSAKSRCAAWPIRAFRLSGWDSTAPAGTRRAVRHSGYRSRRAGARRRPR